MISSSGAEVWKIDPSDGSLYVVTKRLQGPTDSPRLAGERSSPRQLKVQVTAAELLPAITGKLWVNVQVWKYAIHMYVSVSRSISPAPVAESLWVS